MKYLLNKIQIILRWSDMDMYKHLYHGRYFDFMGEARVDFVMNHLKDTGGLQFVVMNTQCHFKKPAHYPGIIAVKQYCTKVGNSSFELSYEFFIDGSDELIALGHAKMVCFDPQKNKPTALPNMIKKALSDSQTS